MRYTFTAKRWEHGWELQLDGSIVTQVRTLERAEQQARDWISTVEDRDASIDDVVVIPALAGDVLAEVAAARNAVRAAAEDQVAAGRRMRAVAGRLRQGGLSVADTAHVLGVSRGRVSQLTDAYVRLGRGGRPTMAGFTPRRRGRLQVGAMHSSVRRAHPAQASAPKGGLVRI